MTGALPQLVDQNDESHADRYLNSSAASRQVGIFKLACDAEMIGFGTESDQRMLKKAAILCGAVLTVSCGKKPPGPPAQPQSFMTTPAPLVRREWGEPRFNVCGLLEPTEVAEVQNGPIKETKSAGGPDDSLFISQCFYLTPDMQLSVEVSVIEKDVRGNGKRTPETFWNQMFRREANQAEPNTEDEEAQIERKNRPPPQRVPNLGRDAYWTNGALYVLIGDRILRVAISGLDSPESRLVKAKSVAQKALSRM